MLAPRTTQHPTARELAHLRHVAQERVGVPVERVILPFPSRPEARSAVAWA